MRATAKYSPTYERAKDDWYVEGVDVTAALLRVEDFANPKHDPACGQGNTIAAMLEAGLQDVTGSDLVQRVGAIDAPWWVGFHDFLEEPWPSTDPVDFIMNPPYGGAVLAQAFIRRAVGLGLGKVAVLVDARFLFSGERAKGFFRELPPSRVWLITPRCSIPPGEFLLAGGKRGGGKGDFAWIVYDPAVPRGTPPAMGWCSRKGPDE